MKEDSLRIVVELTQSARDACLMKRTQHVGDGEIGALECAAESARASNDVTVFLEDGDSVLFLNHRVPHNVR